MWYVLINFHSFLSIQTNLDPLWLMYLLIRGISISMRSGSRYLYYLCTSGLSSLGVPSVPWHTHILADQLTLFQPGGTNYAHLITTAPLLKIPKTDEKIAVTSTMDFSYRNAIKVRWMNWQKIFPISFEDTANFSYLPNRILPPY